VTSLLNWQGEEVERGEMKNIDDLQIGYEKYGTVSVGDIKIGFLIFFIIVSIIGVILLVCIFTYRLKLAESIMKKRNKVENYTYRS